jgi:hypothetical protein
MVDKNLNNLEQSKANIERMLHYSQTKVIFPVITLGLLKELHESGKSVFADAEIRRSYEDAVRYMINYLGHTLHIGGKYYDAYPSRNLPRYGVVKSVAKNLYEILAPYTTCTDELISWIPERIKRHISERLGIIPNLGNTVCRLQIAEDSSRFVHMLQEQMNKNPSNFEIISFALIKVHLEKFACKVYRDTRTSAHDNGVDISTTFGVVYQIKKLKIHSKATADNIYAELKLNFDNQRLHDGNVILVIDDISKDVKSYLIDMKVQSISKGDLLKLAFQFDDVEERQKVLRIVYEEFSREYASVIKCKHIKNKKEF